jgi:chromosome segregation protein
MQHLNCDKDLQRAGEECLRLEDRLAVMGLEREQLEEERELLEREIAATGAGRDRTTEQEKLLGADLEDLNRTVTEQRRELESAREVVTTLKVRVAALSEKRESTLRACKRVTELVHDLAGRISGHRQELERGGQERERLLLAIAGSDGILRDLAQQERTADTLFAAVRSRFDSGAAALREADQQLKLLRTEAEAQRRHAADCGVKVAETALQLRHMEDSLGEKYRLDMAAILPRAADPEWDDTARRDRLQELQRLVEEMGEVNLTAIDEYREMEERFTFLTEQKGDLEESLNSLQQAIQRINRTTRKRFMETFQLVNVKFQEVFPRLFCGGRAELRLSAPEDLLETGIDIIVQPPGKKLQNVTLLSGGEKALTAVALIFAIFLIKPSPFCLLDEVDAPLDDANIGRFNEMIREMTAFSQFILITHSKTTMAVADTLYGVTMEEPGVSKLVSVRLH